MLLADKVRFREKAKKQSTEDMNIIKTKLDTLEKDKVYIVAKFLNTR